MSHEPHHGCNRRWASAKEKRGSLNSPQYPMTDISTGVGRDVGRGLRRVPLHRQGLHDRARRNHRLRAGYQHARAARHRG